MPRYGDNFTRVDVEIFPNIIFIPLTDNSFLNSICYILTNPLKYLFHRLFFVFCHEPEYRDDGGEGDFISL